MPLGKNLGPAAKKYEAEAKAWVRLRPLIGVAVGVVIGFLLHALLF